MAEATVLFPPLLFPEAVAPGQFLVPACPGPCTDSVCTGRRATSMLSALWLCGCSPYVTVVEAALQDHTCRDTAMECWGNVDQLIPERCSAL